jgi:4-alpha-glucanotransferase
MNDAGPPSQPTPFVPGGRASGVLLHVTSLPSAYGIGDLGPSAFAWVDRLAEAGQSWWQALPLGPTGYGDSPYQPLSSFAGNVLLISPEQLVQDGLLEAGDVDGASPAPEVDYDAVIPRKHRLLLRAWSRFRGGARRDLRPAFDRFCRDESHWLDDYALFRALKFKHNGAHYLEWPAALVRREPDSLDAARRELADLIDVSRFAQYLAFSQGARLRDYGRARGVRFIGDLPFFVAGDSADVWAHPECFRLDEHLRPRLVAGVPPDAFSAQGQLWGNPVYDWDALRRDGFRWWLDRLRAWLAHVDLVRLDHFRGFAAAWHVPVGAITAQTGEWVPGPGPDLFRAVRTDLGRLPLIAEDLGLITDDVRRLREEFRLPGMRVLQFAFDGNPDNPHLPRHYGPDVVAYTGTHDNDTTRGWYDSLPEAAKRAVWGGVGRSSGEAGDIAWELIRLAWSSPASLAMAPLQDVLGLGSEARMNRPGHPGGNWRWRFADDGPAGPAFERLRRLTEQSGRLAASRARAEAPVPAL